MKLLNNKLTKSTNYQYLLEKIGINHRLRVIINLITGWSCIGFCDSNDPEWIGKCEKFCGTQRFNCNKTKDIPIEEEMLLESAAKVLMEDEYTFVSDNDTVSTFHQFENKSGRCVKCLSIKDSVNAPCPGLLNPAIVVLETH